MSDTDRARAGCVLLAEDNPVSQVVTRAMLANLGFDVDVVPDGAEAVTAAGRKRYDMVLMDCRMPVLDGYHAAKAIRRLPAGSRRTPIIAVTTTPAQSGRPRALAAGMDDYLAKPCSAKALRDLLDRYVVDKAPAVVVGRQAEHVRPSGPGRSVLDPEIIARLTRLGETVGEDLLRQLADMFLADAGVLISAMHEALAHDDVATVVRWAHSLGGASANVGAEELARLCAVLEAAGAAGQWTNGRLGMEAIETEFGWVRLALLAQTRTW